MSKMKGLTLEQTLELFKNEENKFMYCRRNNGMISPRSMQIMTFKEALAEAKLRKWSYEWGGVTFECLTLYDKGFYIINDDGTFSNVHRMIIRLLRCSYLREGEEGFITLI